MIICVNCHHCKVGKDNCVRFDGLTLQIPEEAARYHYVKATVEVLRHLHGMLSVLYGPRRLARYDAQRTLLADHTPRRLLRKSASQQFAAPLSGYAGKGDRVIHKADNLCVVNSDKSIYF